MSYKALKCVKRKHKLFRKYKDIKHPACKRAVNKASRELKKAKRNFEKKLAYNINKKLSYRRETAVQGLFLLLL